jgi:hypothetical protein
MPSRLVVTTLDSQCGKHIRISIERAGATSAQKHSCRASLSRHSESLHPLSVAVRIVHCKRELDGRLSLLGRNSRPGDSTFKPSLVTSLYMLL